MSAPDDPIFDLVLATVGRAAPLGRLLDSLEDQDVDRARVLLVDQNPDDRLVAVLAARPGLDVVHLRCAPGLSRARNAALPHLRAGLVAFPDDDCAYPPGLLAELARRFDADPALDGVLAREVEADGSSGASWPTSARVVTRANVWNGAISFGIFLRRHVLEAAGPFDERLGLGATDGPWQSGEEIDLLIRALDAGARIVYDPALTVLHASKPLDGPRLRAVGRRDGASVGLLLRKHRYRGGTVARMLARPAGGVIRALAHADVDRAGFHAQTLRGRIEGLRSGG